MTDTIRAKEAGAIDTSSPLTGENSFNLPANRFQIRGCTPSRVWIYRDEECNQVGAVARFEAGTLGQNKEYRQWRFESGRFVPGLGGAKLPLYRLPELLQHPSVPVVWVEGEKCADAIAKLGYLSTTTAGGAGGFASWLAGRREELTCFSGRPVLVLPDNDEPGREYAQNVARALLDSGADVRLVDPLPWADLGEGADVLDWLAAGHDADELRNVFDCAKGFAPAEPADDAVAEQEGSVELPPPPLDALPGRLGEYVQAVADAHCVEPSMPFTCALGVAASAVGRAADIQLDCDWREISPLWVCVVAPPGAAKSPILKALSAPMHLHDNDLDTQHASDLARWELECSEAEQGASKPERPRRRQAVVSDTTIEGLVPVLEVSPRVLAYHDELGALFDSMGCYKAHGGHDRQFWLSLHNGSRITVNRKQNPEPMIVDAPRLGIVGATTPAKASKLALMGAGDGGIDRFYFTGASARPRLWPKPAIPAALRAEYEERILALCKLATATTRQVPLSAEAGQIFGKFYVDTPPQNAPGFMQGVASKHCGHVGRIALMLALLEDPATKLITAAQMQSAIRIGDWLLEHTFHQRQLMLGYKTGIPLSTNAQKVLAWIERKGMATTVSDLLAGRVPGCRTAVDANATLSELEILKCGRWRSRKTSSGRSVREFVLVSQSAPKRV